MEYSLAAMQEYLHGPNSFGRKLFGRKLFVSCDSSETHQENQDVSVQFITVNRENHNK